VADRERYTCIVKLTDKSPTCSCNIPQLQKLPCEHVIATYAKKKGCANISMYSLCALLYTVENYSKTYAGLSHLVPDSRTWAEYSGLMIFPPDVRRSQIAHLLSAYAQPWMKRVKAIDAIGVAIANCHNKAMCCNQPAPSSSAG